MRRGYQNTDKQAAFRFLTPISLEGVAEAALTARVDRAPFEDVLFFPVTLLGLTARAIPTAAVERGPSDAARSGSKGMLWL